MSLSIKLYNSSAALNKLNKTNSLTNETAMSATEMLEAGQGLFAPSLLISSTTTPTYNYCYISDYARYYFIESITWAGHNLWSLFLSEDVLMSFKTEISALYARALYSKDGHSYLNDSRLVYKPTKSVLNYSVNVAASYYIMMTVVDSSSSGQATYIMDVGTYGRFLTNYWAGTTTEDETKRVAIAKCITGIYRLWNFPSPFDLGTITSGYVLFNTGKETYTILLNNTDNVYVISSRLKGLSPHTSGNLPYKDITVASNLSFSRGYELSSTAILSMPYIGDLTFNLAALGTTNITSLGYRVHIDFLGATYVATLLVNGSEHQEIKMVSPINSGVPFLTDNNLTNWANLNRNVAYSGIATLTQLATKNFIGAAGTAINTINSVESAKLNEEVGFTSFCSGVGQNPFDALSVASTSLSSHTPARLMILMNQPVIAYPETFWDEFGYPDGEFRLISSMSAGLAVFDYFILSGFTTAKSEELTKIENLLKTGIIL